MAEDTPLLPLLLHRAMPAVCASDPRMGPGELVSLLFVSSGCFAACLSKALGLGIVLFASIIKLPQIVTIWRSKSGEGVSTTALCVEQFGYIYNLAAHYREDYPLTTYGDFISIAFQNMVLLGLLYTFRNQAAQGGIFVIVFSVSLVWMCSPYFSLEVLRLLTGMNAIVSLFSRVPQIVANYNSKSTGQLSPATCGGLALGSLARVFTTLQEVPSTRILAGYVISAFCNFTIFAQILMYRTLAPAATAAEAEGKKEQ
ncbi:Mannose-P-dolichol utilization defect 1 protein-like [Porphyridium purpureum]|uniref:Mannose-P-dolichol utilization defect 1 protein homolog n=1 Tax=Porphyridium purpureum TaxID=35688 RepID=A0A5J4Z5E4_PORPP|nr:Mannose-P-dolichol utilization defect 1 protein-like [Porphyridium purpureum]|eukprot:POR9483..scf295_1